MNWLKRWLTPPLIVIAAVAMWIEEWLWEHLKTLTGWIAKFPLIRWYESSIQRLPPYPTMLVFLLPGTLLIPVKLGALYLMTHGQALLGIAVIVSAKVLGTAIVARSYVVCLPKLMTIGWFAQLHDWLIGVRNWLYSRIAAMPLYHRVRSRLSAMKLAIKAAFAKLRGRGRLLLRWRAIRRWLRDKSE